MRLARSTFVGLPLPRFVRAIDTSEGEPSVPFDQYFCATCHTTLIMVRVGETYIFEHENEWMNHRPTAIPRSQLNDKLSPLLTVRECED